MARAGRFFGKTQKEAIQKRDAARQAVKQSLPVANERLTVAQFLTTWLEAKQQSKLKPKTLQRYKEVVNLHLIPALGRIRLAQLRVEEVEALYHSKMKAGLSSTTVHHIHTVLHGALESAQRRGYVARNVTALVENKPGIDHKERAPFSLEEARQFLRAISGDRLEALYALAITTGMREGEILGLRW